ncbi:MAG TPA: hypothetical protein VKR29_00465 [Candidatus Binataceae bacterium]|nr:hypothetical protein [Candidatus Binataceae bacterium]
MKASDALRIGRMPIHFFVMAAIFFALGVATAPFMVARIVDFFYQPPILALVHTFTLGWITASIMGVMYRYVPALTRHPIAHPRLAMAQFIVFLIGTIGIISHFANGIWAGTWFSAGILIVSIAMFAAIMLPCLYPKLGRGVAETGMFLSVCFLFVAACIGFMLSLDKTYNFLGGDVLSNLASHVHFAAIGWVTLTICAVSYRMLPAFLLPTLRLPRSATWQLWALAVSTIALGITLPFGLPGEIFWSFVIAAALIAYMITIGRLMRTHRMPIDFTARHAIAGIVWLVLAILCGLTLAVIGPQGAEGNRMAAAYGAMGLLGWVSNFIIGMSYQLFPGFVARARASVGWSAVTIAELSIKSPRWLVFVAYNGGVAMLAAGFMLSSVPLAQVGAIGVALGGLVYSSTTLWTLSFAYRSGLPRAAHNPLRVLPG